MDLPVSVGCLPFLRPVAFPGRENGRGKKRGECWGWDTSDWGGVRGVLGYCRKMSDQKQPNSIGLVDA